MIERELVKQKMKERQVLEFISESLSNVGHSHTKMQRTPLGEKITIFASRPGLVVGRGGQNIKKITAMLKKKFNLENPQIEIQEVENPNLDAQIIAERIASFLERFGSARFKGIGHRAMGDVMSAGALGVEIIISGKIPGARARRWRFYSGYLKKCGDVAVEGVKQAYASAELKSGVVGINVKIMPPETKLPDKVKLKNMDDEKENEKEENGKEEKIEKKLPDKSEKDLEKPKTSQKGTEKKEKKTKEKENENKGAKRN